MNGATRDTSLGAIRITEDDGAIVSLDFISPDATWQSPDPATPLLEEAFKQLDEYLSGIRREFVLPLAPQGTDFEKAVWDLIALVPYGSTAKYGDLAKRLGKPGAARAVGSACGRNPVAVFIPCHRIVPASFVPTNSATYGGYSCGVSIKRRLLELENEQPGIYK